MKRRWSIAGLFVFVVGGCAGANERQIARAKPPSPEARRPAEPARTKELDVRAPDDRFAVAHQVTALERAIELYQMFIERAGDDPRYAEAVRRSQGRIEDARVTICFLLEKPCDGSEKP